MAPPTHKPRLSYLDPDAVAEEAVRLVRDHLGRLLAFEGQWGVVAFGKDGVPKVMPPDFSQLRLTVRILTHFAQRGLPAFDWETTGEVRDAVQEVCEALYSCPGEPGAFGVGPIEPREAGAEPDSVVGCVLVAAWERMLITPDGPLGIAQAESISRRDLAVLASVDPQHLSLLARAGELEMVDGEVSAEEARRFLSGRGVAGF